MTITKFEHACLVAEHEAATIVIDPGVFSASFQPSANIVAVVATHLHPDHLDPEKIQAIVAQNPGVQLFTTAEAEAAHPDLPFIVAQPGTTQTSDVFQLEFFGGQHAVIHPDWPPAENLGVMINNSLYYPGDSFVAPGRPVQVLAVPASAPWLKVQEAMDFLAAVQAPQNIPTHDAILSAEGQNIQDNWLRQAAEKAGLTYRRLNIGETLTLT